MTNVKFNLHTPLGRLESSINCRFSPGDISICVNGRISRQTVHALLNKKSKSVTYETIAALLDFFSVQGMPITIADLFEVTTD